MVCRNAVKALLEGQVWRRNCSSSIPRFMTVFCPNARKGNYSQVSLKFVSPKYAVR